MELNKNEKSEIVNEVIFVGVNLVFVLAGFMFQLGTMV